MRKDKMFFCGIVFVFALVLAGCPSPSSSASNEYKGLGEKLNLSGQVYTRGFNDTNYSIGYTDYKGSLNVSDGGIGGAGKIVNGKFSYSITQKPVLSPVADGLAMLQGMYDSVAFSPKDAQGALLNLAVGNGAIGGGGAIGNGGTTGGDGYMLSRETLKVNFPSLVYETIYYVYVDRDTVVTAEADTFTSDDFYIPVILTTQRINLKLQKGWNVLYGKATAGLTPSLESGFRGNLALTVANPPFLKWVLGSLQELPF